MVKKTDPADSAFHPLPVTLPVPAPPPPAPESSTKRQRTRKDDSAAAAEEELIPPVPPAQADGSKSPKSARGSKSPKTPRVPKEAKPSNPETKGKRTLYMRQEWPGVIFYRDCTFSTVARKNEAKAIWQSVKTTLKTPKDVDEVIQALVAKGLSELEEPKGYSWDDHHKAWQLKIWWSKELVHFGYLKSEDLAAKAGKALLAKRSALEKSANFRALGQPIFAEYKQQDSGPIESEI